MVIDIPRAIVFDILKVWAEWKRTIDMGERGLLKRRVGEIFHSAQITYRTKSAKLDGQVFYNYMSVNFRW